MAGPRSDAADRHRLGAAEIDAVRVVAQGGADVAELVSGIKGREVLKTGNMEAGIFWAGMSQGLIDDIPSCADLLGRIAADAESIIRERLVGMLA